MNVCVCVGAEPTQLLISVNRIVKNHPRPVATTYPPVMVLQMRPLINHRRADRLDAAKLGAHAQDEHHEEERHRPDVGCRHHQNSLWIGDKRQAGATLHHLVDGHVQVVRHEAEHREHGKTGEDGREHVRRRHENGVRVDVVAELGGDGKWLDKQL